MPSKRQERIITNRRQLFDFLQSQMQATYADLKVNQRLAHESSLIKSYIFEVNAPKNYLDFDEAKDWFLDVFRKTSNPRYLVNLNPTEEEGFFHISIQVDSRTLNLYVDATTDPRFWFGFSISESQLLDRWLENLVRRSIHIDMTWLWPKFLENIQSRGFFRGFGLDYDYRKFELGETEATTYLKMQLWGGENTRKLYELLQSDPDFRSKVVLSKVRFKRTGDGNQNPDAFAIQDVKYNGKFTARGTDLGIHLITINEVRDGYRETITEIEKRYALRWVENQSGRAVLEGFAIHFIPDNFELPVNLFVEKIFDGTDPFRLLGFPNSLNDHSAVMEVVDLHTGGKLSIELHPDVMTIYLPENTCGNTIARLYTNLQHTFDVRFKVETDNGDDLFN